MSRGFNLPFVSDIPVEVEGNLNRQANEEITYLDLKNKKTLKKFMSASSDLRKVADYLSDYFRDNPMETLSYQKIARALGMSEQEVAIIVSELAGWQNYPLVLVRSPKKAGHFQMHSKSQEDTEKFIQMTTRNIASRQQRLDKTVSAVTIRGRIKKKQKQKASAKVQVPEVQIQEEQEQNN